MKSRKEQKHNPVRQDLIRPNWRTFSHFHDENSFFFNAGNSQESTRMFRRIGNDGKTLCRQERERLKAGVLNLLSNRFCGRKATSALRKPDHRKFCIILKLIKSRMDASKSSSFNASSDVIEAKMGISLEKYDLSPDLYVTLLTFEK